MDIRDMSVYEICLKTIESLEQWRVSLGVCLPSSMMKEIQLAVWTVSMDQPRNFGYVVLKTLAQFPQG